MCWSEKISWASFVVGTFLNAFNVMYFRTVDVLLISIVLEYVLLIQFFEALAWRDQNCGKLNAFASNGILTNIITQPILICFMYLLFVDISFECRLAAFAIIFAYILYIIRALNSNPNFTCLQPSAKCTHLDYSPWTNYSGMIYCVVLFAIIGLVIRPFKLSAVVGSYIFITLVLSGLFYSCSAGSIWCWFASFAPLVVTMYFYLQK